MSDLKPGCIDIDKLVEMQRHKEVSLEEILATAVKQVRSKDDKINSFLTVRGDGGEQKPEDTVDESFEEGSLSGVPYAVKDNFCTADLPTTCASRMLSGYRPPYDATAVRLLEEAGALLIGKTNMDEFAMGSSTENSAFAVTRNPWDLERVPGGSSGGSAAAVASGQVAFALGSDTGGSVRQPASYCGVVGMKPTYGSISRYGVVAFASSLDQVGPITRTVDDCARLLDVIVRPDKRDSTSVKHPDEGEFVDAVRTQKQLQDWRIGIPTEYLSEGVDEPVRDVLLQAVEIFSQLGATVKECSLQSVEYALPVYYLVACSEASSNLARYDGVRYGLREKSDDVQDMFTLTRTQGFGEEVKRRIMLGAFALSAGYYEDYYLKAARLRRMIANQLDERLNQFDLLLTPTSPSVAFPIGERIDDPLAMYMADICTIPANLAGIPAISIPAGFHEGLPVGIQLMARKFADKKLLTAAKAFESVIEFQPKRPPVFYGDGSGSDEQ